MKKTNLLSIAVVGLIIINLCLLGLFFYGKREMSKPPMHGGPKNIIIKKLHFDKGQVAAYEKIVVEHQQRMKEADEIKRKLKTQLFGTLAQNNDVQKDSLIQLIGQAQMAVENIHYKHFLQLREICRLDQYAYFDELRKDMVHFFAPARREKPTP